MPFLRNVWLSCFSPHSKECPWPIDVRSVCVPFWRSFCFSSRRHSLPANCWLLFFFLPFCDLPVQLMFPAHKLPHSSNSSKGAVNWRVCGLFPSEEKKPLPEQCYPSSLSQAVGVWWALTRLCTLVSPSRVSMELFCIPSRLSPHDVTIRDIVLITLWPAFLWCLVCSDPTRQCCTGGDSSVLGRYGHPHPKHGAVLLEGGCLLSWSCES